MERQGRKNTGRTIQKITRGGGFYIKKALIVGIDNYLNISDLTGCVNDAHDVALNFKKNSHSRLSPAVFYFVEV